MCDGMKYVHSTSDSVNNPHLHPFGLMRTCLAHGDEFSRDIALCLLCICCSARPGALMDFEGRCVRWCCLVVGFFSFLLGRALTHLSLAHSVFKYRRFPPSRVSRSCCRTAEPALEHAGRCEWRSLAFEYVGVVHVSKYVC